MQHSQKIVVSVHSPYVEMSISLLDSFQSGVIKTKATKFDGQNCANTQVEPSFATGSLLDESTLWWRHTCAYIYISVSGSFN